MQTVPHDGHSSRGRKKGTSHKRRHPQMWGNILQNFQNPHAQPISFPL